MGRADTAKGALGGGPRRPRSREQLCHRSQQQLLQRAVICCCVLICMQLQLSKCYIDQRCHRDSVAALPRVLDMACG